GNARVFQKAHRKVGVFVDRIRGDIDEQQARDARGDEAAEGVLDAQEIQLQLDTAAPGCLEQVLRRVQPAVGGSTGQRLETADTTRARVDDWLKQCGNTSLAHQLRELVCRGIKPAQSQGWRI